MSQLSAPNDISLRGLAIYDGHLKSSLEPNFNAHMMATHVDSGDYEAADTAGSAMRAMRKRHSKGSLHLHTIGPVAGTGLAGRTSGTRVLGHRA